MTATNIDLDDLAGCGEVGGQVGHGNALNEGGGESAAGGFADRFSLDQHRIVGAGRRSFFRHAQGNQLGGKAGRLLGGEGVATDKVRFVQGDKHPETGLERSAVGRKVGAVERVTHFEAQRVAGAEAAGFGPGLEDGGPDVTGQAMGKKSSKPVSPV